MEGGDVADGIGVPLWLGVRAARVCRRHKTGSVWPRVPPVHVCSRRKSAQRRPMHRFQEMRDSHLLPGLCIAHLAGNTWPRVQPVHVANPRSVDLQPTKRHTKRQTILQTQLPTPSQLQLPDQG